MFRTNESQFFYIKTVTEDGLEEIENFIEVEEVEVEEDDGLGEDAEAVKDEIVVGEELEEDELDEGNEAGTVYREQEIIVAESMSEYNVLELKVCWEEEEMISKIRNQLAENKINQIFSSKAEIPR